MTEDAQRLAGEILTEPIERDGDFWRTPGYVAAVEIWNGLATENSFDTAVAAPDEAFEMKKSRETIDFVMAHAKPGTRFLDVGCGYGRIAKYLLPVMRLEAYVGVDSSPVMLRKFQERYAANQEEQRTPLVLVQADIDRLPLREASVDACIVSAVFLHNHKDVTRKSIAEIHRVLKPGGRLLVTGSFPNAQSLTGLQGWAYLTYLKLTGREKKNGPVRFFSRREVDRLLGAFDEVKIHPTGFSLFPKVILVVPPSMRWPYRRFHDIVHAFLKRRWPERIQNFFCRHYDVVAVKADRAV